MVVLLAHRSRPRSLNPLPRHLSAVKTGVAHDGILVLVSLDDLIFRTDDDFDMAWVTLVGVDTTMSTVCAAAGFLKGVKISRYPSPGR
jgi:hypothetical protein